MNVDVIVYNISNDTNDNNYMTILIVIVMYALSETVYAIF